MGLQELFPLQEFVNRAAFNEFVENAYTQFQALEAKKTGWGTVIVHCEFKLGKADEVIGQLVDRTKIGKPKPLH